MSIDPTAAWKSLAAEFLAETSDEESPSTLNIESDHRDRHTSSTAPYSDPELHPGQSRSPSSILTNRRNVSLLTPTSVTEPEFRLLEKYSTHPKMQALTHQARQGRTFSEMDDDVISLAEELDVIPQELSIELVKYKSDVYLEKINSLLKSAASQDIHRTTGPRGGSSAANFNRNIHMYSTSATNGTTSDVVEIIDEEESEEDTEQQTPVISPSLSETSGVDELPRECGAPSNPGHGRRTVPAHGPVGSEATGLRRSTRLRNAPVRVSYSEFGDDSDSPSLSDEEYVAPDGQVATSVLNDDYEPGVRTRNPRRKRGATAAPVHSRLSRTSRKRGRDHGDTDSEVVVIDLISSSTLYREPVRPTQSVNKSPPTRPLESTTNANEQSSDDKLSQFRILRDQQRKRFKLAVEGKLAPSEISSLTPNAQSYSTEEGRPQDAAATAHMAAIPSASSPPVLVQFQHSISTLPDVIFTTNFESPMSAIVANYGAELKKMVPQDSLPTLSEARFRYEGETLSADGTFGASGIDTDLDMVGSKDFQGTTYPLYIIDVSYLKK